MAIESDEQAIEKANLLLSEARWRRDDQTERHESLNRRLNTLFALNFAVLAVLGASLQIGDRSLPQFVELFLYATLFVLVSNILLLLFAYRIGKGSRRPDLGALHDLSVGSNPTEIVVLWTVREIRYSMRANEEKMEQKAQLITAAMTSSGLAVLMVAAGAALALSLARVVCD